MKRWLIAAVAVMAWGCTLRHVVVLEHAPSPGRQFCWKWATPAEALELSSDGWSVWVNPDTGQVDRVFRSESECTDADEDARP